MIYLENDENLLNELLKLFPYTYLEIEENSIYINVDFLTIENLDNISKILKNYNKRITKIGFESIDEEMYIEFKEVS